MVNSVVPLGDCEIDDYSLEIWECQCGFVVGIDATYLDQVDEVKIPCPSCGEIIIVDGFE